MRRFRVKVNNEEFEVEVEELKESRVEVSQGPVSAPAPALPRVTPKVSAPAVTPAPKAEPKPAAAPRKGAEGAGQGAVLAPIPGVISQIKVSPGTSVKRGQILLYLEAMKMQNEILAPYDAVVTEVAVTQGVQVQTGDLLVRLDH